MSRLKDLVRLAQVYDGIAPDLVEEAMMVTRRRANELLNQAHEMKLLWLEYNKYKSTHLGNEFILAVKNNNLIALDNVLCEYSPYYQIKNILSIKAVNIIELKQETSLSPVALEMIIRLITYTSNELNQIGDKYYLRRKDLPEIEQFYSELREVYRELNLIIQWGQPRKYIRLDKIANQVCTSLQLSLDDFSKLLEITLSKHTSIAIHSKSTSFHFLPFSKHRIIPGTFRKHFINLRI